MKRQAGRRAPGYCARGDLDRLFSIGQVHRHYVVRESRLKGYHVVNRDDAHDAITIRAISLRNSSIRPEQASAIASGLADNTVLGVLW